MPREGEMVFETKGKGKKDAVYSVSTCNSVRTTKQCKEVSF